MIALSAVAITFVSERNPIVVREVVDNDMSTVVVVSSMLSGADGFISTAYTRKTSWFRTSSWRLTCSCTIVPAVASSTRPEMMIGWLIFENAARLIHGAKSR